MAQAKIELPGGSVITITGNTDEIMSIINTVEQKYGNTRNSTSKYAINKSKAKNKIKSVGPSSSEPEVESIKIHTNIVSMIHDSEDYATIDKNILDKKDRVAKILLCYKFANDLGVTLTTSDVEIITDQLGIKIASSNVAKVIRHIAKKYLSGDQVRKQGAKINYKINRAGIAVYDKYLKNDK